jgi:KRAB domain-containing zinc finger protein
LKRHQRNQLPRTLAINTPGTVRRRAESASRVRKEWKCRKRDCRCVLASEEELREHQAFHRSERKFACLTCGKRFKKRRHLADHELTHGGEKNFMCDFCPMRFYRQSTLDIHRKKHLGENVYPCHLCSAVYRSTAGIRRHLLLHKGTKQFLCHLCSRCYIFLSFFSVVCLHFLITLFV